MSVAPARHACEPGGPLEGATVFVERADAPRNRYRVPVAHVQLQPPRALDDGHVVASVRVYRFDRPALERLRGWMRSGDFPQIRHWPDQAAPHYFVIANGPKGQVHPVMLHVEPGPSRWSWRVRAVAAPSHAHERGDDLAKLVVCLLASPSLPEAAFPRLRALGARSLPSFASCCSARASNAGKRLSCPL